MAKQLAPANGGVDRTLLLPTWFVRCVCVTASLVVFGCALLGFGGTCLVITSISDNAGPCPHILVVSAFAVAGALLAVGLILLCVICTQRKKTEYLNEPLNFDNKNGSAPKEIILAGESDIESPSTEIKNADGANLNETIRSSETEDMDHIAMIQKTEDVSSWIEQHKSIPDEYLTNVELSAEPTNEHAEKEKAAEDEEEVEAIITSL